PAGPNPHHAPQGRATDPPAHPPSKRSPQATAPDRAPGRNGTKAREPPQSSQKSRTISASLSWCGPKTRISRPSSPASKARAISGDSRIEASGRVSTMSWSSVTRPEPRRATELRRQPDRVGRPDLDDVVVELDAARAGQDDEDLLGLLVAVGERLALAG